MQDPLDRRVAVKLIKPGETSEAGELYFKREVRIINMLRHPNVVNILDFGSDDEGLLYLVMEYLPGRTLRDVIAEEVPLEPARICNMATQVLGALE
ncbi:MAG: protein kinase, partial [Bradymonadaceae bacterium]